MIIRDFLRFRLFLAPADETGAGTPDGNAGDNGDNGDAAAAAAAAAKAGGEGDAGGDAGAGTEAPAAKWWEGERFTDDERKTLTASGLTTDDPLEAVKRLTRMEQAAQKRLGKPADSLIEKPGKDQDVAEWLRQHGDALGIPKTAEDYKIERPESWPKEADWDTEMEASLREIAHKHGMPGSAVKAMTELYAGKVAALEEAASTSYQGAMQKMEAELRKDWGDQFAAKQTLAQQAAQAVAERAGLGTDDLQHVGQSLAGKTSDAVVLRMFAAIGEMMGDDRLVSGGGGGGLATTPAEARQKLAELQSPEGAYAKAVAKARDGDKGDFERLKQQVEMLTKIAAR